MIRIDCGISGNSHRESLTSWRDLGLGHVWEAVVEILAPGTAPRSVQVEALAEHRLLDSRRNAIISAPTNSGKSLVATLLLFDAVRRGRRAVLLEPLRAIAREKVDELEEVSDSLGTALGQRLSVRISTGDYRLEDESFESTPQQGEIIVATPERFDAILRNPKNDAWIESIDVLCVDEAHLISSANRGPTLEYLLTYLLCLPVPPRIVLLSATLGNTQQVSEWLSPVDIVQVTQRYPLLHKEILRLEAGDDLNVIIRSEVEQSLAEENSRVLLFVYQTRSAERLAAEMTRDLGQMTGEDGALAYHSRMSISRRATVRESVISGRCRCVVSTTALGMGVNLPVDKVIVRDITFPGAGDLSTTELMQMMGRAGRGDREGRATVVLRQSDGWDVRELEESLRSESVATVRSHFTQAAQEHDWRSRKENNSVLPIVQLVASQLARRPDDGFTQEQLQDFFAHSLGGRELSRLVPESLAWLSNGSRLLAFRDECQHYRLTVLGHRATRAVMPLTTASGFGRLVRDLLTIDGDNVLLEQWRPLDHLLVLELLSTRRAGPTISGVAAFDGVDSWMESHPTLVPLLYRQWINGSDGASRAQEILGSLGVETPRGQRNPDEWSRRTAYAALAKSIILYERGQGTSVSDIERQWRIRELEGIEERWRDEMLWLLSGLGKLCEIRCFYYHLREDCGADDCKIRRVDTRLKVMRHQVFDLIENVKYCSPLGPMLRSVRRMYASAPGQSVGMQTIRRLEDAGVRSVAELSRIGTSGLVELGVRRDLAKRISTYVRRRMQ